MINLNILKTIVTKLGGIDTSEKNHVDTYTENRINMVKGVQIATSGYGGIWIEYQDLAGYKFMNVVVVGKNNLKTMDGCELIFEGKDFKQKLASDTMEIESDYSNVSNSWVTQIAFDVTDSNVDFIENKLSDTVAVNSKKITEIFNIIK